MVVVSNASPLVALSAIGQLDLLHALYHKLLIPEAVHVEVVERGVDRIGAHAVAQADWILRRSVVGHEHVQAYMQVVDWGEAEAIVLASEAKADLVLLDDLAARQLARQVGDTAYRYARCLGCCQTGGLSRDRRTTSE